jgi:hypothetical protein
MAIDKTYITLSDLQPDKTVSTKLYIDQYNASQLEKAVDIKVTELINGMPDVNLDLVPKPVYDAEVSQSVILQNEINTLQQEVTDLTAKVQTLTSDSSSLYISNDNLRVTNAKLENTISSVQQTTLELRTNLTTSLTKAINEATERTTLEAENSGLTAQKNALIKQIDTLNNLLAQANASLQVAQQQLSAKAQAVAAGGVSTGQLSTLVWEKGDPSKNASQGYAYDMDLSDGGQKIKGPASYATGWSSNYVDIVAGPKDVKIDLKQTFFLIPSTFNMKANETKRITFDKPNIYAVPSPKNKGLKNAAYAASAIAVATGAYIAAGAVASAAAGAALVVAGTTAALGTGAAILGALGPVGWAALGVIAIGSVIFGSTQKKYTDYTEDLNIIVSDIDGGGKIENKTFKTKVHSYN